MKWIIHRWSYFLLLLFLAPNHGVAQNHLQSNEDHYRLYNGLEVYFLRIPTDSLITLSLSVKAGVFAGNDSLHGTAYIYNKAFSDDLAKWANANGISYQNVFKRERITYIFQFQPSMIDKVLQGLTDKLSAPVKIDPAAIPASMRPAAYPFDLPGSFMEKGKKMLWGDFFLRTSLTADSLPKDTASIRQVYAHYYGADNALILIRGNISSRVLYPKIQNTLTGWKSRRHDYFLEEPVPLPKDMKYSAQFIEENNGAQKPEFVVWMRGPSSRQDKEYYQLSPLLEETIRVASLSKEFKDTSHITDIDMRIENSRYATEIMVRMTPDTVRPDSAYFNLFQYFRFSGDGRIFTSDDVEKAKANLLRNFEKAKNDPIAQANAFADFWSATGIDDYSLYADQLKSVTIEQLCAYTHKYMIGQPYVAGLYINKNDRAAMKVDTFFTNTGNIEDYRFTFIKNNAILTDTTTQDSLLRGLAQTIKINPRLKIMLNGVASKDEYLHINDEDMLKFTEQHPGFTIAPSNLAPTKKIRLDVYRALTVIKLLIQMGVPEDQLTGTGKIVDAGAMQPLSDQEVYTSLNLY